ncbi:MAG: ADP-ribosylglycohydrolase family protein [Oscillospiraceae bacterium]|nr:ADP-ribosylglycohydrolase family protein [Oscillospiraceae bacterium]
MVEHYLEKVYAGFLGMNIGIRLGAPVEPTIWTYERIRDTYGDITGYVKEYKNFAADDDANGPVFFLRALYDDAKDRLPTPQDVARAWLNYAREGVGLYWWGGYGVSTEHTAYLNLKSGIPAPQSGSIEQNGLILAEQIGGQIFIDTWGLVSPCRPHLAAELGQTAASVSHDGNGLWGARFFCAAIAKAFETAEITEIVEAGLAEIPEECTYRDVMEAVKAFHKEHPEDWRACREMLERDWGYDKYQGVCHIIPNAGVCAMALLYGGGDFARTVEIATMAGWDTDCNAGNVGTVLGVARGLEGLPEKYRGPINDGIVCSGISGYLNILDIPTFCKETALLGYRLAGEEAPAALRESVKPGEVHFDFELPGSTHNFRVSDSFFGALSHSAKHAYAGTGSLRILLDRMVRGDQCRVFYKPFYTREDFSDERYSPVFSPTAYPGQTVSLKLYLDQWNGNETPGAAPYVRTASDKALHLQGYRKLVQGEWIDVTFTIPDTQGDQVDEVGVVLEGYAPASCKTLGMVYLDEFSITGPAAYTIAMAKQKKNFAAITPFSMDHGAWDLYKGTLNLMRQETALACTGNYYARDYACSAPVTPRNGESHLLLCRVQGARRWYAAGLGRAGKLVILKNDFGLSTLAECDFDWKRDGTYHLELTCRGEELTLSVDGKPCLTVRDGAFAYGMFGCGSCAMGRTSFGDMAFREL